MATSAGADEQVGLWRGTTAQERLAPRRRRLLDAAFALLAERGSAGTTVRGVCTAARLNPRYFYESFADLDALLAAVYDDAFDRLTGPTAAAVEAAPDSDEAKTRAAIGTMLRHLAEDRRRIRVLCAQDGNPALADRRATTVLRIAGLMADQAARFYGIPRDDALLETTTIMLAGGLFELVLAWDRGDLALGLDELVDRATLLVVGAAPGGRRRRRAR